MNKLKKLSVAAITAVAACAVSITAFAAGVFPFRGTFVEGSTGTTTNPRIKDDNLYAVAYVDSGLDSGNTFLKFSVVDYQTGNVATDSSELWVNGRCQMNYRTGYGVVGKKYLLRGYMPPQANAHTITVEGTWTP